MSRDIIRQEPPLQSGLRALLMLPEIPAGHMTFAVPNSSFHPHLQEGEFAVVDVHDRDPVHGELFLIAYGSPLSPSGFAFRIGQALFRQDHERWWMRHGFPENGPPWAEGPFGNKGHLAGKLIGRVVGVYIPTPTVLSGS